MDPRQVRLDELPTEFPVFPLTGALLLPRGKLPLNIFEPRYLAMVEDALGVGRMFGMIQPDPQKPAGASGPAWTAVWTQRSSPPQRSWIERASCRIASGTVMSMGASVACPPRAWMRSSNSSSAPTVRPTAIT